MNKLTILTLTAVTAVLFAACAAPVENKPVANANANVAKPAAAPPTVAALLELEKRAGEAWSKNDGQFFQGFLADNYVGFYNGKRSTKADDVKMITETKCDIKSMSVSDEKMVPVGPDAAVLVTKSTVDGSCGGQKVPSPMMAATLFVRSGDAWKGAYHSEVPIIAPKSAPAGADKKVPAKADASQLSVAGDDKKDEVKKEEPKKKDEPKKEDAKNEEAGKEPGAKAETKTTDAAGFADELTKALLVGETAGWEAWKARDTSKLSGMLTNEVTFIDPIGRATFGKAENLTGWANQKCEVKSVALSDAKGFSILPTVAILTFKGSPEGTCDGEKLSPVWGTGVYIKEGESWKLAFHLEDMVKKG